MWPKIRDEPSLVAYFGEMRGKLTTIVEAHIPSLLMWNFQRFSDGYPANIESISRDTRVDLLDEDKGIYSTRIQTPRFMQTRVNLVYLHKEDTHQNKAPGELIICLSSRG